VDPCDQSTRSKAIPGRLETASRNVPERELPFAAIDLQHPDAPLGGRDGFVHDDDA
jgi:hypothetical protein